MGPGAGVGSPSDEDYVPKSMTDENFRSRENELVVYDQLKNQLSMQTFQLLILIILSLTLKRFKKYFLIIIMLLITIIIKVGVKIEKKKLTLQLKLL